MRKEIFNFGLRVCVIAPLLAGCGGNGIGGVVTVPTSCPKPGQVLSTDSTGQFICKDLPAGVVTIPKCDPNFDALTYDGAALTCDSRNNESAASQTAIMNIKDVEKKIIDYGTTITMLGKGGMGAKAFFQGVTTNSYKGDLTDMNGAGTKGIRSSATICQAQFGQGAHMCSVYEMYQSAIYAGQNAADKFDPTVVLAKAWVYESAGRAPLNNAANNEPLAGLADNCGSYNYPTADEGWTGTAVSWDKLAYNNLYGLKFFSGLASGATCHDYNPIACCK